MSDKLDLSVLPADSNMNYYAVVREGSEVTTYVNGHKYDGSMSSWWECFGKYKYGRGIIVEDQENMILGDNEFTIETWIPVNKETPKEDNERLADWLEDDLISEE